MDNDPDLTANTYHDANGLLVVEPRHARKPEHGLLLAVLEDAIAALRSPVTAVRDEARAWIEARTPAPPWALSFGFVCDALGLDAAAIRAGLAGVGPAPARRNVRSCTRALRVAAAG